MSEEINSNETYDYKQFLPWEQKPPSEKNEEFNVSQREGGFYLFDPGLKLVTEIAIVTGRPLLLRGEPGSGKSSFAPFVARNLNWRYYEYNITGRTEAKDMLWQFDALRRLRDAQAPTETKTVINSRNYVTPGVLWWAFNYRQASDFITENRTTGEENSSLKVTENDPFAEINLKRSDKGSVVLIDEIDKADPNVPNDLLEVIGLNSFKIDETGDTVKRKEFLPKESPSLPDDFGNLLIVITTNEERDLPPAFLRRCIVYNLKEPVEKEELIERWTKIAGLHAKKSVEDHPKRREMVKKLAGKCWDLREQTANEVRRSPSIAEFLDALKICFRLKITTDSEIWKQVETSVLIKSRMQNVL